LDIGRHGLVKGEKLVNQGRSPPNLLGDERRTL